MVFTPPSSGVPKRALARGLRASRGSGHDGMDLQARASRHARGKDVGAGLVGSDDQQAGVDRRKQVPRAAGER